MKFVVKEGLTLPEFGAHLAKITHIAETTSNTDLKTPQLRVTFRSVDPEKTWSIRKWYNLIGYEHSEDSPREDHVIMKKGKPVISDENTDSALSILGVDANRMGAGKAGESIDTDQLMNCVCGILIEANNKGRESVTKIYSEEYLEKIQIEV